MFRPIGSGLPPAKPVAGDFCSCGCKLVRWCPTEIVALSFSVGTLVGAILHALW